MLCVFGWVKVIYWDPVKSTLPSNSPCVTHHCITENREGADQTTSKLKRVNGSMVWALWWAHIPGGMKTKLTSLEKWKCVSLSIHSWLGLNRHGSRSLSQSVDHSKGLIKKTFQRKYFVNVDLQERKNHWKCGANVFALPQDTKVDYVIRHIWSNVIRYGKACMCWDLTKDWFWEIIKNI